MSTQQAERRVTRSRKSVETTESSIASEPKQPNEPKGPKSKKSKHESDTPPKKVRGESKKKSDLDDLDIALANLKECEHERTKINLKEIQELKKEFKTTCDKAKRDTQILEQNHNKKAAGTTRAGTKRGAVLKPLYTDGKWVNKGIDDASDKFGDDEKEYLKKAIQKFKKVSDLKFEHLKYLICDVFLNDLKQIKQGSIESEYHKRYIELLGKSKADLFAEVKTNLFTNEQRDYLNGLLQGSFDTCLKDAQGDIKHNDINYVEIVIMAEAAIRIVRYVHDFDSNDEALDFMKNAD